jgi:hypothetical protein
MPQHQLAWTATSGPESAKSGSAPNQDASSLTQRRQYGTIAELRVSTRLRQFHKKGAETSTDTNLQLGRQERAIQGFRHDCVRDAPHPKLEETNQNVTAVNNATDDQIATLSSVQTGGSPPRIPASTNSETIGLEGDLGPVRSQSSSASWPLRFKNRRHSPGFDCELALPRPVLQSAVSKLGQLSGDNAGRSRHGRRLKPSERSSPDPRELPSPPTILCDGFATNVPVNGFFALPPVEALRVFHQNHKS